MPEPSTHITLAVFPFEDLSRQSELNIFCRSFSADLVTELSRFRQFQIITLPTSTREISATSVMDNLQTDYYIQGNFRGEQGSVRINVQLMSGTSRHLVWGNRFEGKLTDLNDIQENLLTEIVGFLQQQVNQDLLSGIKKKRKVQFGAYEHWLHGMDELKKGSVAADERAREHFQKALEIQPDYSLACSGMSLTYFNEWSCQLWERWNVSKSGANTWAQKAIELDDQNYIAAVVLGKIFLYEGSYNTSEYYLRKSLQLNSNDPDTLILIAAYFVFLGLKDEAVDLYERTIRLSPLKNSSHLAIGAFIFFERGEFERAEKLIVHTKSSNWADMEAYNAGIYYHLGDHDKMQQHWSLFRECFCRLMSRKDPDDQQLIDWLLIINPHRYESKLHEFLQHVAQGSIKVPSKKVESKPVEPEENVFTKEGDFWKISFAGEKIYMPEVKGFYDISKLLMAPGKNFHCSELMGSIMEERGEKVFDAKAKKQYERKIMQLQADIVEAEQHNNYSSLEQLHEEYDSLLDHLSSSIGLRGKVRETGNPVEKARSAVTWRIRKAIARIEGKHPRLGAHLSNSIKTGTFCSYQPEGERVWNT